MRTFILTGLAIMLTSSIAFADMLDDMFAQPFATETTVMMKNEVSDNSKYNIRYGVSVEFEKEFAKFIKTTGFIFFRDWQQTVPGTKCCAVIRGSEVYSLCISGIVLVVGRISD